MVTMRFAAPRLVESRGKRQARKEAKEMAQVIDHTVTPADGDVLTYEAASGKYAPTSGVKVTTTRITSAQLLALHTTPVALVPAPGPGQRILPFAYFESWRPATTPYTFTGSIVYGWAGATQLNELALGASNVDPTGQTAQTGWNASLSGNVSPTNGIAAQPFTAAANQALTAGDGTLDVTVVYVVG